LVTLTHNRPHSGVSTAKIVFFCVIVTLLFFTQECSTYCSLFCQRNNFTAERVKNEIALIIILLVYFPTFLVFAVGGVRCAVGCRFIRVGRVVFRKLENNLQKHTLYRNLESAHYLTGGPTPIISHTAMRKKIVRRTLVWPKTSYNLTIFLDYANRILLKSTLTKIQQMTNFA